MCDCFWDVCIKLGLGIKTAPVPSKGREGGPLKKLEKKPGVIKCFCNSMMNGISRPGAVARVPLPGVRTEPRVFDVWPPCQTPAQDRG